MDKFPDQVVERFLRSADPKMGLVNFERLTEAVINRQGFSRLLEEQPSLCDLLVRVLSMSQFLTDVLVRNPEYIYWIADNPKFLDGRMPKAALQDRLSAEVQVFEQSEHRIEAIRRLHKRELLRVGVGEASGGKEIDTVGEELSDLADVTVGILLQELYEEMTARYGIPLADKSGERARFTIIGLGKLGGRELNFSSDIDLMFVYSAEGMTNTRSISNYEFFNRLSERLVSEATTMTGEGFLYRVDTRLRPEGRSGPLARSLVSYVYYYEARGEIWERQMLIKARPVAGDASLGEMFLEGVEPFVYPAVFTESPSVEIRRIKEKIEAKIGEKEQTYSHLKLRPGGIRDIEFIIQTLQLLAGRPFPHLREGNTIRAITLLREHGTLSEAEALSLLQAYRFLRRVEHRLQIMNARGTYALPDDPDEVERLAIRLRFSGRGEFIEHLNRTFSAVRRIYDDVFRVSEGGGEGTVEMIVAMEVGDPRAITLLEGWGFSDPSGAQRHLIDLSRGGEQSLKDPTVEERFRRIVRPLLQRVSVSSDPDHVLGQFGRIIAAYGAAEVLYDLLSENEAFFGLVVSLCDRSQFLADLVVHDPGLLDWLVSPGMVEVERDALGMEEALCDVMNLGWDHPLYAFKHRELLRVGCRDILGV
ncbi:MAG: hypothetical protein HY709_03835, partial [Candidatus Latescibacteria bacterium]|nr:hypothetical protein [Candidatus Latescibacterota bacterium]